MPPSQQTVQVALQQYSYSIFINESLDLLTETFAAHSSNPHTVVISDENVAAIYLDTVLAQLNSVSSKVEAIVIPAGEPSKSIEQASHLWQQLVQMGVDRSSVIVALGGGVVGDLAGFVAATYMRGLTYIQVPTSLLAQVDSSVGGKTGINLPQGKNLVGSFLQPKFVLISTNTLSTLDEANFSAGMAEVIKYGLIMDSEFFQWLESNIEPIQNRDSDALQQMIAGSCQCKASVVEEDEHETRGRRAILNYGHTFGHAIEAVFGYGEYLHGEAISIGMTCAARMARTLQMIDDEFIERQTRLLRAFSLPTEPPQERHDALLAAMKKDKKSNAGRVKLILPNRIGSVGLVDWPGDAAVLDAWKNSTGV